MKKVVFSKILLFLVLIVSCFIFSSCMPHKGESISLDVIQSPETEVYASSAYRFPLARFVVQKKYSREYYAKLSIVKVLDRQTEVFWEQEFDIGNTKEIFINFFDDNFVFNHKDNRGEVHRVQISISEDEFVKKILTKAQGYHFIAL